MYKLNKDLHKFSYKNVNLFQERILLRTCLNVTLDNEGKMTDATRFYESLPLIKELALKSPNLVVTAHLGRPEKRDPKLSFKNIAAELQKNFIADGISVRLIEDLDEETLEKINNNENSLGKRVIYLVDNIRFFPGEESKDKEERLTFAKKLAGLADIFINDAFADYRESASTYDVANLLPSYLGPVFLREVESILKLNTSPRPLIAILGGAKLSEKLDALKSLLNFADKVLIGGAMAYTILKANGIDIGKSLVETDKIDVAREILSNYANKIVLPIDHLISSDFNLEAAKNSIYTQSQEIPNGMIAIDIGKKTIQLYSEEILKAKSIIWNGPVGVFEWDISAYGTEELGKAIQSNVQSYKLAGGGDSIAAINKLKLKGFDHISTGGGAMLALLAYNKFPTLDIIVNK